MIEITPFMDELFSYTVVFPAMVLCYLPMRDQLRLPLPGLGLLFAGIYCVLSTVGSYLTCRFGLDNNTLFYPVLIIFFLFYHATVRVDLSRSLCIFVSICALMSFASNIAAAFECAFFPDTQINQVSPINTIFTLGFGTVMAVTLAFPLLRYGSKLINEFALKHIWYVMACLMGGFLLINIGLQPTYYSVLREGTVFISYCAILGMMFTLQLAVFFLFYQIVMTMMALDTERQRVRILEMQEKQFQAQQAYLADTGRMRHDLRHTILALKGMADAGDQAGIADFLDRYVKSMPVNEVTNFCASNAVNATLTYFSLAAREDGIRTIWRIDLPENCPVSDMDLCGILGNILENALRACKNIPESDRSIRLTVTTMNEPNLYIVAANTFDGNVRRKGSSYLSTREGGTGIGLTSITLTAQKYGGSARFHHEGCVFCTDVHIPLESGQGS